MFGFFGPLKMDFVLVVLDGYFGACRYLDEVSSENIGGHTLDYTH